MQDSRKAPQAVAFGKKRLGFLRTTGSGKARNLSLDQGQFKTANAGRLACTKNIWHGGPLNVIHLDETFLDVTIKKRRQFRVGNEMKTACQIIARNLLASPASMNCDTLKRRGAVSGHWP